MLVHLDLHQLKPVRISPVLEDIQGASYRTRGVQDDSNPLHAGSLRPIEQARGRGLPEAQPTGEVGGFGAPNNNAGLRDISPFCFLSSG
jgi:hypothetical protein